MFTGIVQGVGKVISLVEDEDFKTITIQFPRDLLDNLCISYSVAINGCCLSVTKIEDDHISFDIIDETLRLTNLKSLQPGTRINLERSATMSTEVGGHFLSGHIIDVGYMKSVVNEERNCTMQIGINDKALMKYIFYKGYVAIDGISLTIGDVFEDYFEIHLIPETLEKTTIMGHAVGDAVNIEVDSQTQIIVNTVERVLREHYTNLPCLCQCNIKDEDEDLI
uniref:Riboflavin synthase n=1 Tax=Cacopsylla melanoneura TaxID=428564 RepID=A0A8D8VGQ4_9HEMI